MKRIPSPKVINERNRFFIEVVSVSMLIPFVVLVYIGATCLKQWNAGKPIQPLDGFRNIAPGLVGTPEGVR